MKFIQLCPSFFTLRPDFSLSFLSLFSSLCLLCRSSVSLSLAAGVARWAQYVRDLQQYEARVEDEQTAAGALQLVGRLQAQRRTRLQQYYSRHVGKMRHRGMCSAFAGYVEKKHLYNIQCREIFTLRHENLHTEA